MSSKVLAVGAFCPFVQGGVGAVASQAYLHPYLGLDALPLLAQGLSPQEVIDRLLRADEGRDWRQLAIVDAQGRSAAYTGGRTDPWCGHRTGPGYAAAGNLLIGAETVDALAETFESTAGLPLPERLMRSLEAAQAAGGDRRGRQSAAMRIVHQLELPYLDLRVDDHPQPVAELRRLLELAPQTMIPLGERVSTTRIGRGPEELAARQQYLQELMKQQGL